MRFDLSRTSMHKEIILFVKLDIISFLSKICLPKNKEFTIMLLYQFNQILHSFKRWESDTRVLHSTRFAIRPNDPLAYANPDGSLQINFLILRSE